MMTSRPPEALRRPPLPLRASLWIALLAAATAPSAHAQLITGRLLDVQSEEPIPWGTVQLLTQEAGALALTVSDENGYFTISAPGPGRYLLHAGAYLYFSIVEGPFAMTSADTVEIVFRIPANPVELDPIVVEASRLSLRLLRNGYYQRRQRGLGHFVTRQEVLESHAHNVTSILATVPGMRLTLGAHGGQVPIFNRAQIQRSINFQESTCFPSLWVDGQPLHWDDTDPGSGIDDLVTPYEVEGIELYGDPLQAPTQYTSLGRAYCGVILIWTRRR